MQNITNCKKCSRTMTSEILPSNPAFPYWRDLNIIDFFCKFLTENGPMNMLNKTFLDHTKNLTIKSQARINSLGGLDNYLRLHPQFQVVRNVASVVLPGRHDVLPIEDSSSNARLRMSSSVGPDVSPIEDSSNARIRMSSKHQIHNHQQKLNPEAKDFTSLSTNVSSFVIKDGDLRIRFTSEVNVQCAVQ